MYKIMLFAGTTEGRELLQRFRDRRIQFHVFVATGYGGELLQGQENVSVHTERLNREEMEAVMQSGWDLVLDATHPYAVEVSENIRAACESRGLPYMRIVRERALAESANGFENGGKTGVIWVPDMQAAAEYLEQTKGKILLTTGSKEIEAFTKVTNYKTRIVARVLPVRDSLMKCLELGFKGSNLICMQGPFSTEMNREMLLQVNAKWLVTKESGRPGGFQEKLEGARAAGAEVIVVGRPAAESGCSFAQAVEFIEHILEEADGATDPGTGRQITMIGIGPGPEKYLCQEAAERIRRADLVIGAKRMTAAVDTAGKCVLKEWHPDAIRDYLAVHPEFAAPVILLSGDTGFYSGAKRMGQVLEEYRIDIIPGISSLSYMAARLGKTWEQVRTVSIHGRQQEVVSLLMRHRELFVLLDKGAQQQQLCEELITYGYHDVRVSIGENLGTESELISIGRPGELLAHETGDLSVVWIEQLKFTKPAVTPGLPDESFIRTEVPMTKREVRTISLAALSLCEDSILYDIGAGTGSVSIEAARQAYEGQIYAIEKKEAALQLLEKNIRKFRASNVYIVPGTAPEILTELPPPDRVFIGGSSGNMKVMLDQIYQKWPYMRTVVNAASLETLAEVTAWLGQHRECESDIVQISAARAKPAGHYHMMQGGTVVYVITIQGNIRKQRADKAAGIYAGGNRKRLR